MTTAPHDPGRDPESEGIPDLQDGTPQQQRAEDPQQEPVPGDTPTAVTQARPTANELREGESLDDRLAQEEPDVDVDGERLPDVDEPEGGPGAEEPRAGLLTAQGDPDRPRDRIPYSEEGDTGGLSAEEDAVHITDRP